ncbi:MAG: hypothetical protein ACI9XJ_001724 [Marivirga sp.]|jgi:hypothetical protein
MRKLLIVVLLYVLSGSYDLLAQCAMCRATVENNVNNGEIGIANGLNYGILYLFFTPYIIVAVLGFLWYRNSKQRKRKIPIVDRIVN